MFCKNCNSKSIKKRKNFSHGTSSKAKTSYSCSECNSSDIMIEEKRNFFKRRR